MKLERFHASHDKTAVVQYHPQADTTFAKEQGYVVLKIEPWALASHPNLATLIADLLNQAGTGNNHARTLEALKQATQALDEGLGVEDHDKDHS